MNQLIRPENYKSVLSPMETQKAIKKIKDYFQNVLAERLNLCRVSAPLFVCNCTIKVSQGIDIFVQL